MAGWHHGKRQEHPCVWGVQCCHGNWWSCFPGDGLSSGPRSGNLQRKGGREGGVPGNIYKHLEERMGTRVFPFGVGVVVRVQGRPQLGAAQVPSQSQAPAQWGSRGASRSPMSRNTAHYPFTPGPARLRAARGTLPPQGPHIRCSLCLKVSALLLANSSA